MTPNDRDEQHTRQEPSPSPEQPDGSTSLADTDESQEERGRIGYGRYERRSSWLLGAALVLIVAGIGLFQMFGGEEDDGGSGAVAVGGPRIGQPAPDFTLQTHDGEPFVLSEHRGEVVVVNFWGSWCEPCRKEMPALQSAWEDHQDDDIVFVGVGSKRDSEENAVEFAAEYGVTYPIGRDTEGGTVAAGQISKDYQINWYPMTFFIDGDGNISAIIITELDRDDIDFYIEEAQSRTANMP
jgi:cytochrome c biogenesis protein CcmG/thiol:disulfide interchange protein DsbE